MILHCTKNHDQDNLKYMCAKHGLPQSKAMSLNFLQDITKLRKILYAKPTTNHMSQTTNHMSQTANHMSQTANHMSQTLQLMRRHG